MSSINDTTWMQKAISLAKKAALKQEVPVGAVIVLENKLIASAHNKVRTNHNPCDHAEIIAIKKAAKKLNNERLINATLYVTLEPCLMCMGAMLNARVSRLVFGTRDLKAGAAGSRWNFADGKDVYKMIQVDEGVNQQVCENLLTDFFHKLR